MKIYWLEPGQEPMSDLSKQKKPRGSVMDSPWKKFFIMGGIMVVLIAGGLWGCSAQKKAKAEQAAATVTTQAAAATTAAQSAVENTPERVYVDLQESAPAQQVQTTTITLEPAQIEATARYQAAISRPAANPANSPFYVGVVTYEDGCLVSNLGFTTSGYNGKPYYLYINGLLDRDPNMQMVNIRGYVQEFATCQYPVIMVSELFWMDQQGTPAPLAVGGPVVTGTVTGTVTAPTWGQGDVAPTSTPTYTVYVPPQKIFPTPEPLPTYTPRPTYTPQPPDVIYKTVVPLIPTYTPYPTYTPNPNTPTPTPTATPRPVSLFGPVVSVGGCATSNFAISANGQNYYIIFDGATLPAGDPTTYTVLATGLADVACNGQAIRAQSITWYLNTPTPTATSTPTATATPVSEATATEVITS
jgi:hypothetical protein